MNVQFNPPADPKSPDTSTCRNCGEPIAWDEWSYVHANGWADCHLVMLGGTEIAPGVTLDAEPVFEDPTAKRTVAEPVEWNEP